MGANNGPTSKTLSRHAFALAIACAGPNVVWAQANPVPVPISYAESFTTTPHNTTVLPLGWQGWRIGATASSTFETAAPTADVALIANSTAAVNTGGVHNYNGAIGILNSGTMNAAIVLSISTSAHSSVQVSYQLSTIRNPYNGSSNTRIEEATLQYRVGTSGPFTTLSGPVYTTGTTAQTTAVTTPLNPALFTHTLPIDCDHQPIVQLRWVVRDLSGAGSRPSIAIDLVTVTGLSHPMFVGGVGRGDVGSAFTAAPIGTNIHAGGPGRGEASGQYTAAPITASLYAGGIGRGEVSHAFTAAPITASIYSGGAGRGEESNGYTTAPVAASIYAGGNGRGEVSHAFTAAPLTASIYSGGAGRGEESDGYTAAPVTASIYAGGHGRGEVSAAFDLSEQLVALLVRALLGGPFDPLTGLQHDSLRTKGLLPSVEPYTLLGYDLPGGGGEFIQGGTLSVTGPDAPVDWVVVELRAPQQPSQITAARCLLLQRDGDVVDPVTGGTAYFTAPPGDHYISIRHRNHLGAMTALPVALDLAGPLVDFSQPTTGTFGTAAQRILAGRTMLWPGDVTSNGTVKYAGAANDRDPILTTVGGTVPTAVVPNTYATSDVNMDGRVKYTGQGNDRDIILQVIGGTVPTNVRNEQIP